jgi:hypothetical protein
VFLETCSLYLRSYPPTIEGQKQFYGSTIQRLLVLSFSCCSFALFYFLIILFYLSWLMADLVASHAGKNSSLGIYIPHWLNAGYVGLTDDEVFQCTENKA